MYPPNPFAIPNHFWLATSPQGDAPGDNQKLTTQPTLSWWFLCSGSHLLINNADFTLPLLADAEVIGQAIGIVPLRTQFLGYLDRVPCVAAEVSREAAVPEGLDWYHLRSLYQKMDEVGFAIAALAVQIVDWDRTHQYCGHCATRMTQLPTERAKRCPSCGLRQYPRLSPAVIMLIYKGEEVLLARAPRFRAGMYSVLAGFVEPGESLEETVAREVREEVGIEIKNIRYFGSQPWPFPNSLMIGFVAEYASGKLMLEPTEIESAAWFSKEDLPPVPGKLSIARKLIDWFIAQPSVP
ncbi:NADH pyrophosphatase-like rudimentary NUDIX domain family [Synechococcus sp. PCC 7335]|uniref:NAD(+) diphosphatase n=1 Tax=Synechococcus sp. (strain ATCC 29403 / PCC 7335) TaxID=91464 RepID=UPI00017EE0D3|nr:NAD(+) diphosphatase [Synechococcus sp. PCC 7335]EDX87724.1 NADH pyrophosphatase-like rudimentary NUDIX domain family [Synechococcus sp. PCC 7335]